MTRTRLVDCVVLSAISIASLATAAEPTPGTEPPSLPAPYATPTVINAPQVVGWPDGKTPQAPAGLTVNAFARLEAPRWLYVLPNGDVLVAEALSLGARFGRESPNRITLLRDADHDGFAELAVPFLTDLNMPFGMALAGDALYVGVSDHVLAYPYQNGQTHLTADPKQIADLPFGGHNNHWTRNLLVSPAGDKLYVTVGSSSDIAEFGIEAEHHRANILEMNLDGTELRVFASGMRNPTGLAWEPVTHKMWTVVNERNYLGDDLVPDFFTSVRDGGFYGWPYAYFGPHPDPQLHGARPDLVAQTIVPDVSLGAHTAPLGLLFYTGQTLPEKYRGGAFIAQRGSSMRSKFDGYRVLFIPFADGRPAGPAEDFLTGFIAKQPEVYGRPVGLAIAKDGALLVGDEGGKTVWRVAPPESKP